MPDFVVALSLANLVALTSSQNTDDIGSKTGHQSVASSTNRLWVSNSIGKDECAAGLGSTPFASSSSGIKILSLFMSCGRSSASATKPGTSSLTATHTLASSSHVALMTYVGAPIFLTSKSPPKSCRRSQSARPLRKSAGSGEYANQFKTASGKIAAAAPLASKSEAQLDLAVGYR